MSTELEDGLKNMGFEISDGEPPVEFADASPNITGPTEEEKNSILDFSGTEPQQTESEAVSPESSLNQPTEEVVSANAVEEEAELNDEEFELAMAQLVGERLGLELNSLEDLQSFISANNQASIDERVKAIADFVSETGRDPMDWFRYQSINTSEMDDLTAIKIQTQAEYPNLSNEEVNLLINSKYKTDEDMYSEDEIRLSNLQLKIDAQKAKAEIERIRDSYRSPILQENAQEEFESPITPEWISAMESEADAMNSLTFDLGQGGEFDFAITPEYRQHMKNQNARIDEFFDQYVDQSGNWNYELLHAHRALIDNIDEIARSLYNQGMSDGRRQLVEKAANVDMSGPAVSDNQNIDNVSKQVMNALFGDTDLRMNF